MKKQILSVLLALVLACLVLPLSARAEEDVAGSYVVTDGFNQGMDYLVLNDDGTGMITDRGYAYSFTWELSGRDFSFTDHMGATMTGTLSGGAIQGSYRENDCTWSRAVDAPITAFAPEYWNGALPCVYDQAGLLSDDEVADLTEKALAAEEKHGCQVCIVTVDDFTDYCTSGNIETFAEELHAGYGLGHGEDEDLVLLVLSMADRDYDLMAFGPLGEQIFTPEARSKMEDTFLPHLGDNDWEAGFSSYIKSADHTLQVGLHGDPVMIFWSVVISLVLAFLIAWGITGLVAASSKATAEKGEADSYVPSGGCNITLRQDQFSHTTVNRVYDPPTKSSGGGGGGSSGSSGHSHSSGKF